MSQYPAYGQNYYPPTQQSPRPTAVTVLAIIGIIWAILMLLCNGFGLFAAFMPNFAGPNPATDLMRENTVAHLWSIAGPVIGLLLSIVLLAGSIGALKLEPWGRHAMNAFALLEILAGIVNVIITVLIINPIVQKSLEQMPGNPMAASKGFLSTAQSAGAVIGLVITCSLPAFILIFMNRPNVKAAFAGGGAMPGQPPMYPPGAPASPGYPPPPPGPYSQ